MKKLLTMFLIITGLVGLVGCSEEAVKEPAKEEPKVEEKEVEKEVSEAPAETETDEYALDSDFIMQTMENSFGDMMDIEYDEKEKIFNMSVIDDDLALAIAMSMSGEMSLSYWNDFVDSVANFNMTMGEGYSITLENPANPDKIILVITEGVVLYDAISESL